VFGVRLRSFFGSRISQSRVKRLTHYNATTKYVRLRRHEFLLMGKVFLRRRISGKNNFFCHAKLLLLPCLTVKGHTGHAEKKRRHVARHSTMLERSQNANHDKFRWVANTSSGAFDPPSSTLFSRRTGNLESLLSPMRTFNQSILQMT
jgi:hypothetical protein